MQNRKHNQRGVTLVVVLLILLVVTVVGIGGAQISLLAERSARFDRDFQVARQAAEAALMDAEFDIYGPNTSASTRTGTFTKDNVVDFIPGCGSGTIQGLCQPNASGKPIWYQVDFMATGNTAPTVEFGTFTGRDFAAAAGSSSAGIKPAKKPRYIIEVFVDTSVNSDAGHNDDKPQSKIYRVTAMGFGPRQEVQAVLQIVFKKEV